MKWNTTPIGIPLPIFEDAQLSTMPSTPDLPNLLLEELHQCRPAVESIKILVGVDLAERAAARIAAKKIDSD